MLTKSHGKGKSLAARRRFGKRGPATVLAQRFIQPGMFILCSLKMGVTFAYMSN